ncbi:hypothetical protein MSSIT_1309 [Methanosarcina siciliae T4/M]|uniref:Transglutaminase-like domain-containing protein n=3 Tax=Methanosarcina siciliae TaxID=38027 RepID=A0A0E3PC65_9EURY|nr:transglutaminase domain-containing protein [Methanosarcina siciliae]AKB28028.1 hypothetical protein MSSIT_1309 [Methanosarcina siciliae T4/M]AKB31939.1 hypothetical protein MSSIH_1249 [Methanosarcina siciliae HI350]
MVGNRMKKINIVLLAAFILAGSVCACESLDAGNFGINRENVDGFYEAASSNVPPNKAVACGITSYCSSVASRISGSRYFNLMDIIETTGNTVGIYNWKFDLPSRGADMIQNRQPMVQNNQLAFSRDRSEQLPPGMSREDPVRRGIPDREELNNFMQEQQLQSTDVTSNYQMYVTPDAEAVESYLEENDLDDKYDIYEAALSWTWVSDETLNNEEEQWLTPTEFLEETPDYSSNPVYGEPASDCEEQANTLASLLIASGEYNESTVRVAIGKVDFGDVSGGHAWVEVYEDGEWLPLDATDGPYYDDDSSELIPADSSDIDYDQYRDCTYPAVEVWYYYNNEYFIDLDTQLENAPVSWNNIPESYQKMKSGRF